MEIYLLSLTVFVLPKQEGQGPGERKRWEGVVFADPPGVLILESFLIKGVHMGRKAKSISDFSSWNQICGMGKAWLGKSLCPDSQFCISPRVQ